MHKLPKRALSVVLALSVASIGIGAPARAKAQTVFCTNCSNVATQLLQQAAQAEQLVNQALQYQKQIESYINQVQNTLSLPATIIGDVKRDIDKVRGVFEKAKGLAYTVSNMDEQFLARYKSVDAYLASGMSRASMSDKYKQWSSETNDSVLNSMKALKAHSDGVTDEYDLIEDLKGQVESADGQKQALDAANQLALEGLQQSIKLRELIALQIQLSAQDMQIAQDKEAAALARAVDTYKPFTDAYAGKAY